MIVLYIMFFMFIIGVIICGILTVTSFISQEDYWIAGFIIGLILTSADIALLFMPTDSDIRTYLSTDYNLVTMYSETKDNYNRVWFKELNVAEQEYIETDKLLFGRTIMIVHTNNKNLYEVEEIKNNDINLEKYRK